MKERTVVAAMASIEGCEPRAGESGSRVPTGFLCKSQARKVEEPPVAQSL